MQYNAENIRNAIQCREHIRGESQPVALQPVAWQIGGLGDLPGGLGNCLGGRFGWQE